MKPRILVIVGPTASGKSDLAVALARELDGEVVSADSRQVYRGLNIGTGKITIAETKGVKHHCLDIADPIDRFSVSRWKRLADDAIEDILRRGKLPIVCGGTGFYTDALVRNLEYPDIDLDEAEQIRLEKEPASVLFAELLRLDPIRAMEMKGNGSFENPRRVARAILIARELGEVPKLPISHPRYDAVWIGILPPDAELRDRIRKRLVSRLENGMIEEAQTLHSAPPLGIGLSYERMDELGLEYRYIALYLQGKLTREELTETLATRIWQYARRQKTWWRRNADIRWFRSATAEYDAILRAVRETISPRR
jgi:tRNA dimethylallyltransferase